MNIRTEQDWEDMVDAVGIFNIPRLKFLVFVAETMGWKQAAARLRAHFRAAAWCRQHRHPPGGSGGVCWRK